MTSISDDILEALSERPHTFAQLIRRFAIRNPGMLGRALRTLRKAGKIRFARPKGWHLVHEEESP